MMRPVYILILALFFSASLAAELPPPGGAVVLSIHGNVSRTNADGTAEFDMAALDALPQSTIATRTAWTGDAPITFSGVLMRDLMDAVGATGTSVQAVALNNYMVDIPLDDFAIYDVLLATRLNGERMRLRDFGPLWIVYPQDDHPELQTEHAQAKMVWQLRTMTVE